MEIKGDGFILRKPKLIDAEAIYKLQQDQKVKKGFMSVPKSVVEVKKEIRKGDKNGEGFVIDINGEVGGEISFHFWEPPKKFKAILSLWVAKKYRRKGIATNAIKLITKYAFKKYPIVRMQGNIRTFNKASAKACEKAGYKLEGVLRKNKMKGNKYYDDYVYAKVK